MPKQFITLNDFSGGINSIKDPRDIASNEMQSCKNMIGDKQGMLRTVGGNSAHALSASLTSMSLQAGYGLFSFAADHVEGSSAADTGENYIALSDSQIPLKVIDETNGTWATYDSFTNGAKSVFYFTDEVLRTCDSNFNSSNKTKWYGYIKRTHFTGSSVTPDDSSAARNDIDEWYSTESSITKPGTYPQVTSSYPSSSDTMNIEISVGGADTGSWEEGTWQIAMSFIYDGNQESLLAFPSGSVGSSYKFTTSANDKLTFKILAYNDKTSSPFNSRITGARFYCRKNDTDESWILLSDVDLSDGARGTLDGDYSSWAKNSSSSTQAYSGTFVSEIPNIDTYETLNGYTAEEVSLDLASSGEGFKTAVVANRRVFVANVKFKPEGGSTPVQMRDRLMYTPVGKFDTFPRSYYVDVVKGDAEEYVKLEEFGDRLLAFKQRTLYIINISNPSPVNWYLEGTYKFKGVPNQACVTKTDFGVVWANSEGAYIFDGSNIRNLTQNKIEDAIWQSFADQSDMMVGYDPKKDQIIVVESATVVSSTDTIYVYDLRTQSWTIMDTPAGSNETWTNFVIDYNNDLVYASGSTATLKKWTMDTEDNKAQNKIYFQTKDIDFNDPGRLKKIYSVVITYKASQDHVSPLSYDNDGGKTFGSNFVGDFTGTGSGWKKKRFTLSASLKVQSLALQIKNTHATSDSIAINDISIEYRQLRKAVS